MKQSEPQLQMNCAKKQNDKEINQLKQTIERIQKELNQQKDLVKQVRSQRDCVTEKYETLLLQVKYEQELNQAIADSQIENQKETIDKIYKSQAEELQILKELQSKIQQKQQKMISLEQLVKGVKSKDTTGIQITIIKLEMLKKQNQFLEEIGSTLHILKSIKLETFQQRNDLLSAKQQVILQRQKNFQLRSELLQAKKVVTKTNQQIDQINKKLQKSNKQNISLKQEISGKNLQFLLLSKEIIEKNKEIISIRKEILQKIQEPQTKIQELLQNHQKLTEIQQKLSSIEQQLFESKQQCIEKKETIDELKDQLEMEQSIKKSLETYIEELRHSVKSNQEQLKQKDERILALQKQQNDILEIHNNRMKKLKKVQDQEMEKNKIKQKDLDYMF